MSRVSLLLTFLCLVLSAALIVQHRELLTLRQASVELQRQLPAKSSAATTISPEATPAQIMGESSPITASTIASSAGSTDAKLPHNKHTEGSALQGSGERSRWMVDRQIERAERYVALTAEERERIRGAMTLGSLPLREALRTELGEERAAALFEAENAEREEEERRQIEDKVLLLSRKLTLTPDQERALRQALNETGDETSTLSLTIRSRIEELSALHTQGDEARPALRAGYEELRSLRAQLQEEQIRLITNKLTTTLSPEQRSSLAIELAREAR